MITLAARQRAMLEAIFGDAEAGEGLAIYRRNVAANLRGALAATYPVVARLVGPAFFAEAARRFALESPSTSGDLHEYGADFAAFLTGYEHARAQPYLADVARLEWACHRSLHARAAPPFDFVALAAIPPERYGTIRFAVNPSLHLLRSVYPIAAIWRANQPDRDGTPERRGGEHVVVWRGGGGGVRVLAVDEAVWTFLAVLASGSTLADAIDDARGVADLEATLRGLVADRILVGFDTAPSA